MFWNRSASGVDDNNTCLIVGAGVIDLAVPDSCDPLLAKHGQSVQHRPWPGAKCFWRPPGYRNIQACWCRLWVSSRLTDDHLERRGARAEIPALNTGRISSGTSARIGRKLVEPAIADRLARQLPLGCLVRFAAGG
jgi:hypothetical protein